MTDKAHACPVCENGTLVLFIQDSTFSYKGRSFRVPEVSLSRCDTCGTEMSTPQQARQTERKVRDFQRRIDGLLGGEEIRVIRERFSLTQAQANEIFGGGPNAFSKYERGEVVQSVAMDRLLRLVSEMPHALPLLLRIAGIAEVTESRVIVSCDYGSACGYALFETPHNVVSTGQFSRKSITEQMYESWHENEKKVANG